MDRRAKAEAIYLELYEYLADKAEYFQPEDAKLMLPEVVVSSLVATTLIPFLKGFFENLGKGLADKVKDKALGPSGSDRRKAKSPRTRVTGLKRRRGLPEADATKSKANTEALLQSLEASLPQIQAAQDRLSDAKAAVYQGLRTAGLSAANSQLLAEQSVEIIRKHIQSQ